ncbi:MAG: hypothetical protein HYX85_00685 [Chloroflexi bacterium]|nr:hypothetical protein [Chloroflexota bacterium]
MPNPSGPYPGRQLFLGLTVDRRPCFAYLVTGRSPESRQRKAVTVENTVRIGPIGDVPYDPLRHYTAVKYDNGAGIACVSNGIQTEAIFETYRLILNVGAPLTKGFMENLLEGAGAEPDSLHTPRIAGVVIENRGNPVLIAGIKTFIGPAVAHQLAPEGGCLAGISTYKGDLDNPEPTDPSASLKWLGFTGASPQELAKYLYDLSAAAYKGEDIRVCAVGGVYSGRKWDVAVVNRY